MSRDRVIVGLLIAMLAYGAYWFATRFERVTEKERVGYQGEARDHPLLAAMRLAQKLGLPARRVTATRDLDTLPADGVLVLLDNRAMDRRRANALLAWVARGGHVVTTGAVRGDTDPLLDALGVRRERAEGASQTLYELRLPAHAAVLRVQLPWTQSRVRYAERHPRAEFALRDKAGKAYLLHYRVGDGAVTLVPGLGFAVNSEIANLDHAQAFWELVNLQPGRRSLWIATRLEAPSLARWLRENALAAVGTAVALIALWLWRVVPRFGPIAPDPVPGRRRLLDHLRAAGRFHWRHEGSLGLLAAAREACLRRLARVHPDLAALPPAERAREAAARTDSRLDDARLAFEWPAADAREFARAISALQAFEDRLNRRV